LIVTERTYKSFALSGPSSGWPDSEETLSTVLSGTGRYHRPLAGGVGSEFGSVVPTNT
jgi:hypothetical protein